LTIEHTAKAISQLERVGPELRAQIEQMITALAQENRERHASHGAYAHHENALGDGGFWSIAIAYRRSKTLLRVGSIHAKPIHGPH